MRDFICNGDGENGWKLESLHDLEEGRFRASEPVEGPLLVFRSIDEPDLSISRECTGTQCKGIAYKTRNRLLLEI